MQFRIANETTEELLQSEDKLRRFESEWHEQQQQAAEASQRAAAWVEACAAALQREEGRRAVAKATLEDKSKAAQEAIQERDKAVREQEAGHKEAAIAADVLSAAEALQSAQAAVVRCEAEEAEAAHAVGRVEAEHQKAAKALERARELDPDNLPHYKATHDAQLLALKEAEAFLMLCVGATAAARHCPIADRFLSGASADRAADRAPATRCRRPRRPRSAAGAGCASRSGPGMGLEVVERWGANTTAAVRSTIMAAE